MEEKVGTTASDATANDPTARRTIKRSAAGGALEHKGQPIIVLGATENEINAIPEPEVYDAGLTEVEPVSFTVARQARNSARLPQAQAPVLKGLARIPRRTLLRISVVETPSWYGT